MIGDESLGPLQHKFMGSRTQITNKRGDVVITYKHKPAENLTLFQRGPATDLSAQDIADAVAILRTMSIAFGVQLFDFDEVTKAVDTMAKNGATPKPGETITIPVFDHAAGHMSSMDLVFHEPPDPEETDRVKALIRDAEGKT